MSVRAIVDSNDLKVRLRSTNFEVGNNYKSFETELCLAILNIANGARCVSRANVKSTPVYYPVSL